MSHKDLTTQQKYVRKHKREHHSITFWRIFLFVLFLLYWEVGAKCKWFDSFFFSSPSGILSCIKWLWTDFHLCRHISITLFETCISFLCIMVLSLSIAILFWYHTKLAKIAEPYLVILNSLPKSALAPLFIVWFGTNQKTVIIAGISVGIFGSIMTFLTMFQQSDPEKYTLIQTFGGNKKDILCKLLLPESVPGIINACKVNIGLALVGVIIGEFLSAKEGLGYLIIYGSQIFRLDMVITGIIILCLIALGFYQILQTLEHSIKKHF